MVLSLELDFIVLRRGSLAKQLYQTSKAIFGLEGVGGKGD